MADVIRFRNDGNKWIKPRITKLKVGDVYQWYALDEHDRLLEVFDSASAAYNWRKKIMILATDKR